MILLEFFLLTIFFFMGASIGSFLGVVIDRVPRKESIIVNQSHCVKCGKTLKWYMNVPLLSYTYLKGRCAECNEPILYRYFLIELVGALIGLLVGIIVLSQHLA